MTETAPLDPQIEAFLGQIAALNQPKIHQLSPKEAREGYEAMRLLLEQPAQPIGKIEDRRIKGPGGEIPVRVYHPVAGSAPLPVIVFYHGGGFVIGSLDSHDDLCRRLVNETGFLLVAVDYRLAPEHPYPAAPEDAWTALKWVESAAADLGADPNRLILAGDSAGGNLAAVTAIRARSAGGPEITHQLLIYPVTQAHAETPSMAAFAEGYFLERQAMDWFVAHYLPDDALAADPGVSPLLAEDLSGLPPATIVTAGYDPLRDEGKAYADRLSEAGVAVSYRCEAPLIHGFANLAGVVDAASEAVTRLGRDLAEAVN